MVVDDPPMESSSKVNVPLVNVNPILVQLGGRDEGNAYGSRSLPDCHNTRR